MRFETRLFILLVLGCIALCPAVGRAEGSTPFQISLFHPYQWHPADESVDGFRWDIIYGVNEDIQGIDLGMVNNAHGDAHGLEIGVFNRVNKDFGGVELGFVNEVKGDFKGVQLGVITCVSRRSFQGVQASVFFNEVTDDMRGLQLGIVNHAGSLDGVQIGLFNFNDDTKHLGFFPFINAAF